ncbi:MAG: methyltransferase domain-containing protein [Actinomycetota bacterium]|nr:methyltransferase domain-containing protein [Actinomycetota bacterium]
MQEYLEDLWQRLPEDVPAPELDARLSFLRAELEPGDCALDLGCGDGRFTAELAGVGSEAVGADVAQAALRRAVEHHPALRFVGVPIDGPLPFRDNRFTVVWASEVIEHVADTGAWLSEVRRVLAPRGRLLVTTPSHGRLRLALGGIERFSPPLGDHLHLYSRGSLWRLLHEFGFGEITIRTVGGPAPVARMLLARAVR